MAAIAYLTGMNAANEAIPRSLCDRDPGPKGLGITP
jgi:hypothetical protein